MNQNNLERQPATDAMQDIPALLWVIGMDGRLQWVSREMKRYLPREVDLLGLRWADALHPDDLANWENALTSAAQSRSSFSIEHRFREGPASKSMMSHCSPTFDKDKTLAGYAGISEWIYQQESPAPKEAKASALVHDVRNVLAPISTGIAILKNQLSAEKHGRLFKIMEKQMTLLTDLIGGGGHSTEMKSEPSRPGPKKRKIHRVLVVDDNPNILELLKASLEDRGFSVDCSLDGESGLHKALEGDYDACICDLAIPKVNGLSVGRTIHSNHQGMLLISMSGSDSEEIRQHSKSAGFSTHLVKPISMEELIGRLS